MKKLILALLLVSCAISSAQTTSVTGTITDSDGTVWSAASVHVTFTPNPSFPNLNTYNINGVSLTSPTYVNYLEQIVTANGSGAFAVTLLDNTQITPAGSRWTFVVQSNSSATGVTYTPVAVSGASQSLTSFLSTNSVAPRFPALLNAFGYADVEVTPIPNPGGFYFNTVNNVQRIWNGASWQNGAGGGGSVTWPPNTDIVVSNTTNTPGGLAPVNGDTLIGSGGAWSVVPFPSSISGLTAGDIPQAGSPTGIINSNPLLDNGNTNTNALTYAGSGGMYSVSWTGTSTSINGNSGFGNGSGGDSTCPTPASGINYLCNQGNFLNLSSNLGPYYPLVTANTFGGYITGLNIQPAIINRVLYISGVNGTGIGVAQIPYVASTQYNQCQAVSYTGNNWIAVTSVPGTIAPGTNTNYWYPVPNAYTPTQADCAFYVAASKTANSSQGWTLMAGQSVYNSCIGFVFPTVASAGAPTVNVRGTGPAGTIFNLTCNLNAGAGGDGFAFWYLPDAAVAFNLARFDWEGFTLEANNLAPAVLNLYGAQQSILKNIDFRDPIEGADHVVEFGDPGGSNAGWDYELDLEDLQISYNSGGGSGFAATVAVAGGVPTVTITNAGSGYKQSYVQGILAGTISSIGGPCNSAGTQTVTVTTGTITGYTTTASGCTSPMYANVYGNVNVNYGFKFSHMTDSHMISGLTDGGVGAIAGIYVANISSANVFYKVHPIATLEGVEDIGRNSWISTQMDTISFRAFDFEGQTSMTNVYDTLFEWAGTGWLGPEDYYFGHISNFPVNSPLTINIYGDKCGNSPPTGYTKFASRAGSIDTGTVMPPFVHVNGTITYCNQLASTNPLPDMTQNNITWSNGYYGNNWIWGLGSGTNSVITLTNPLGYTLEFASAVAATSGSNSRSPVTAWAGFFWNGTVSTQAGYLNQLVWGAGTNPTATMRWLSPANSGIGTSTTGAQNYSYDQPVILGTTGYSAAGTPLPTCNAFNNSARASVVDATAPTYLGTYTSGGTVHAPVFCNGTAWVTD